MPIPPSPQPAAAEIPRDPTRSRRAAFWRRNTVWPLLSGGIILIVLLGYYLADWSIVRLAAWSALILLNLCLLPGNIFRLAPHFLPGTMKYLSRYRRDFGISAGIVLLLHATYAYIVYAGLLVSGPDLAAIGRISLQFALRREILLGEVSLIIIILLLLTSSLWSQQWLKTTWKLIHSWIWILPPLALVHALLASSTFRGIPSQVAVVGLGILIIMGLIFEGVGAYQKGISWITIRRLVWIVGAGVVGIVYTLLTIP